MFKIAIVAALLSLASLTSVPAADFSISRGINMDIWDTWPSEDRWHQPHVILPYPEWQRRLGDEQLGALRTAGFDFVRIPVDPAPFLSPKTRGLRDALFKSVGNAVRSVNAADLKAIVDLHLIPGGDNGSFEIAGHSDRFDHYLELVRRMAQLLADVDPGNVALEVMNEPVAGCDGAERKWSAMQKRLHETARSIAPELTLILTGGCWSDADSLAAIDPADYADSNVIWTFHNYRPFLLTHQGASWAGDFIRYVTGLPYPPYGDNAPERDRALARIRERIRNEAPILRRPGMLTYLDEQVAEIDSAEKLRAEMEKPLELAAAWAENHSLSKSDILLGEFGMIRQEYGTPEIMRPEWRAAYVGDMIELAERFGFAWAIWGYGGAFGIVEAFGGTPAEPAVVDVVRELP